VDTAHDVFVASSRLARNDPSIVLGLNMHLVVMLSLARQFRVMKNRGDDAGTGAIADRIGALVKQGTFIAAAVSEPDQTLTRQQTIAHREDAGWRIDGRKIMSSGAPAATHLSTSVNYADGEGRDRYAFALVARDAAGVTVHDDWDALGMRGSGSVSVTFDNAAPIFLGSGSLAGGYTVEYLELFLTSGPAHASASLGVAEMAHQIALDAVAARRARRGDAAIRPTVHQLAAENSIDIAAMRAVFGRALEQIDAYFAAHPTSRGSLDEAKEVFAEAQRAKQFVNAAAQRVVDRAMTIVGGAAYSANHSLSRLYRDVRAGAFMHPLGANVANEYIGAVTLGMEPPEL
jgi:alkylation response protein AidB-like acyl-CoA dehydrogenase